MTRRSHIMLPIVTSEDRSKCDDSDFGCSFLSDDRWCRLDGGRYLPDLVRHEACIKAEGASRIAVLEAWIEGAEGRRP